MQNYNSQTETPKLKIKKTIHEEKEIDIDIPLPYYCKYAEHTFIKIKENKESITVSDFGFDVNIKVSEKVNEYYLPESTPISQEEFNQAYETALSKIQNQTL